MNKNLFVVSAFSKSTDVFVNYCIITTNEMQGSTKVLIESYNRRELLEYYKDRSFIINIYTHLHVDMHDKSLLLRIRGSVCID